MDSELEDNFYNKTGSQQDLAPGLRCQCSDHLSYNCWTTKYMTVSTIGRWERMDSELDNVYNYTVEPLYCGHP